MKGEKLTTVIIDDEKNNAELLHELLSNYCDDVSVVGIAYSVEEGVRLMRKTKPQVVFLDIQMGDGSGFDLLNQMDRNDFDVVFTTAHEEYALQAIKALAVDYLLKPLTLEDVLIALKKIKKRRKKEQASPESFQHKKVMAFPTTSGITFKPIGEIVWIEGQGAYSKIVFTNNESILMSTNIGEVEERLLGRGFFRIHNSYIVNINQVNEYKRLGSHNLIMSDGKVLTISRRRKEDFLKTMNEN